VTFTVLK